MPRSSSRLTRVNCGGQVLGEKFVDDRESPLERRVGLFDVGDERTVVDGRAIGERRQPLADVETPAAQAQFTEMVERQLHGPLFGAQLGGVALVGPAPLAFEGHALGEAVGREFLV